MIRLVALLALALASCAHGADAPVAKPVPAAQAQRLEVLLLEQRVLQEQMARLQAEARVVASESEKREAAVAAVTREAAAAAGLDPASATLDWEHRQVSGTVAKPTKP